jgi:hypothetical protein
MCRPPDLTFEKCRRLPFKYLVGEAFEGLAEHDKAAVLSIARAQMEIAQPSTPRPLPFDGQHHEIERPACLIFSQERPRLPAA